MSEHQDTREPERRARPVRSGHASRQSSEQRRSGSRERPSRPSRTRLDARGAVRRAIDEVGALTHRTVEGVVGVERDGDPWKITIEVLEDPHIPNSSDILAEYEMRLSADGELLGCSRTRRYIRGQVQAR
jgi:hypothetical protein